MRWVSAALLIAALGSQALADDYPNRPVTMVLPFPAGSGGGR